MVICLFWFSPTCVLKWRVAQVFVTEIKYTSSVAVVNIFICESKRDVGFWILINSMGSKQIDGITLVRYIYVYQWFKTDFWTISQYMYMLPFMFHHEDWQHQYDSMFWIWHFWHFMNNWIIGIYRWNLDHQRRLDIFFIRINVFFNLLSSLIFVFVLYFSLNCSRYGHVCSHLPAREPLPTFKQHDYT